MASAELSRRVEQVVGTRPASHLCAVRRGAGSVEAVPAGPACGGDARRRVRLRRPALFRLSAETFDTLRDARRREAELVATRPSKRTAETCHSFARRWPDDFPIVKSGPTRGRRKSEGANRVNRERLKPFIADFAGIPLGEVDRRDAVAFAARHPGAAVVARGMFQDALDVGLIDTNPFARLNVEASRGRRDHAPLTVPELHELADLALDVHGKADALERLKRGARVEVRPVRATPPPHAQGGAA